VISFGSMPQRSGDWAWFKPLIHSKSMMLQFEEDAGKYVVYGYDGLEALSCSIWKGSVPPGVVNGGYSQATNDADKAEFEADFKPYSNRSIDDVPSKIIAKAIQPVLGGGNSLAVDGSVTPVVFEYNPPNNYDIEINQLSFLFEDAATIRFGNKFVFNGISTLANGMLLECKADDQAFNWQNMKRSRDLIEICEDFDVVTGTVNFLRVNVHLPKSLRLARDGTFGAKDYIRLTVRDDLSVINFAEAFFQGVKI
jgi:hypothetical protein